MLRFCKQRSRRGITVEKTYLGRVNGDYDRTVMVREPTCGGDLNPPTFIKNLVNQASFRTAASEEEWIVVKPPEEILPWSPSETDVDPERITNLIRNLESSMERVQSSEFYRTFIEQMEGPELSSFFQNVLGSEPSFQMVVYGLGTIESSETSRFQLSLDLSLQSKFNWIGEIQVFDPVLSATEIQVLESLGCSVLQFNEHCRRKAEKPTLFFMPHCKAGLYDNLIELNWKLRCLDRIVLFGNSFEKYASKSVAGSSLVLRYAKYVVSVSKFADEFKIETFSSDFPLAFNGSSWHFFGRVGDAEITLSVP